MRELAGCCGVAATLGQTGVRHARRRAADGDGSVPVVVRCSRGVVERLRGWAVGRVYGMLRTAGYPEPVAHGLAGVMTTVLPLRTWQRIPLPAAPGLLDAHWRLGRRLAAPHLPQGAPTSPGLANLAAYRLDVRLNALADSWGERATHAMPMTLRCPGATVGARAPHASWTSSRRSSQKRASARTPVRPRSCPRWTSGARQPGRQPHAKGCSSRGRHPPRDFAQLPPRRTQHTGS